MVGIKQGERYVVEPNVKDSKGGLRDLNTLFWIAQYLHPTANGDGAPGLEILNGAVAVVPFEEALHGILLPLQERVGHLWHSGRITVAVEHYVTGQIKQKLYAAMNQLPVAEFGATVVVACPPGEEHDLAALAVAYRCRVRGCRVYYLGANVPILSLSKLCREVAPDLTILSITIALPDALASELVQALMQDVAPVSKILAGGRGALAMRQHFADVGIHLLDTFGELDEALERFTRRFPIPG